MAREGPAPPAFRLSFEGRLMKGARSKTWRPSFLRIALAVVFVDQVTKGLALKVLSPLPTIPILPGIFHLTFLVNPGVAFGLLRGQPLLVVAGTSVILLGLLWSAARPGKRKEPSRWMVLELGLILGGAVGNLIDRVRIGGVVDFLDFRVWPVFNVADSCITIGAILMAWNLLRNK